MAHSPFIVATVVWCFSFAYFTIRSFFKDCNPLTFLTISRALSTAFWELTKPLSWTVPW